ncbi:unnamed protein product [Rotaria sp. Silwood2]|nr:unnamed protein product [Rotaria sp. Silwood2]CAF3165434.1 unnamed protein product [Rotaria sp. Silwood2]CAF4424340.1 unnamed protein product [Rotaria sp. Silwood2]CAF4562588.1 unnamed protein product [Rotaria sp. Silwood2]
MSSALISSLLQTNQRIITYGGIAIFIVGLVGGILNIIVFLSLKTFRESSCAFYLTILSIVNIGQLVTSLLTRIMITGFNIDWTQNSLFYCKFRTFVFQATAMISFTCICLATIDQYFATCSRIQWQRWCHIKIARHIMIFAILIAIIEQSPCLFLYDHMKISTTNITVCTTTNEFFIQFNVYFNYLIIGNILPYLITFSFGLMAYRNIKEIAYRTVPLVRRELDKQLTIMVLIQVVYTFFSMFPNMIVYLILAYGNIENLVIVAQLRLVYTILTCLYYSYFASPFYIYACASERFRRQLVHVISTIYLKRFQAQVVTANQVLPHL